MAASLPDIELLAGSIRAVSLSRRELRRLHAGIEALNAQIEASRECAETTIRAARELCDFPWLYRGR